VIHKKFVNWQPLNSSTRQHLLEQKQFKASQMKYARLCTPDAQSVFQIECGKCKIMHASYGHYIVLHSDYPQKDWTIPNTETAYALCHRLSNKTAYTIS